MATRRGLQGLDVAQQAAAAMRIGATSIYPEQRFTDHTSRVIDYEFSL